MALLAAGSPARGAGFATGFADPGFVSPDRDQLLDEAVNAEARYVRINLPWASIATRAPAQPADPADPAYDFRACDAAIAAAQVEGAGAAAHRHRRAEVRRGRRAARRRHRPGAGSPTPRPTASFARAVAARYSGHFGGLPQVRYFQAWNEPNLSTYLTPQYKGKRSVAPKLYRKMLNQFYAGVKAVSHANVVVTGGTAPYGDPPGGDRTRPLTFWRSVLCLKGHKRLHRSKCPTKAKFDVLAHHPINTSGRADPQRPRSRRREHRRLRAAAQDPARREASSHAGVEGAPEAVGDRDLVEQQAAGPARGQGRPSRRATSSRRSTCSGARGRRS